MECHNKKFKRSEPVIIPFDVILHHIFPYAIDTYEQGCDIMFTCKRANVYARTNKAFWESFIRKLQQEKVEYIASLHPYTCIREYIYKKSLWPDEEERSFFFVVSDIISMVKHRVDATPGVYLNPKFYELSRQ